jgi:proline utilization trans-activator
LIAVFGFFDLDAIFSSSFVLLLAAIISSPDPGDSSNFPFLTSSPGIREGLQLLDYLAGRQNHAAGARRDQLQSLHERLPSFMQGICVSGVDTENPSASQAASNNMVIANARTSSAEADFYQGGVSQYDEVMGSYTSGTVEGDFVPVTLPVEFSDDPHAMYSLFHGEGFSLTGENQADFEELQRHFLWHE